MWYIGQFPAYWYLRGVLCALWTRRPILEVAMECPTELAAIHIAQVLQRLHFFQFFDFFYNSQICRKIKLHTLTAKIKKFNFFL